MSVGVVKCWQYFYLSNKILVDLFLELPLLRVLCLSDFKLCEVPESIDTLKHLRYLNLSQTEIKHVPENVSDLFNLQTLILFGCHSLAKLPYSFLKLKNLRHLDIRDTPLLEKMPLGIGELESLRTLSKVIIGVEGGIEITKLKYLKNLCGKISIVGLDKVENAIHAREANISQKRLSELELVWNDYPFGSRDENLEKEVLNELKPPNDCLKQLEIVSYGGLEFLTWVGDPLFLRLKHVSIRGCKSCTSLPLLGQLPSLKELFIERLHVLKVVGLELLGTSRAFPSLEILSFKNMPWWEKWSMNSGVVFPHLQQLHIKDCPNLVEFTLEAMPSLNIPKVNECDSGVLRRLLEMASAVAELKISLISGLNDVVWRGVIEYLGAVEDLNITFCNEIRYLWESEAVASKALVNLRNLRVAWCGNLVSLGQKEEDNCKSSLLTSLRMLDVSHCNNMERCTCPDSIEILNFQFCDSITTIHLPTGGKNLKSLANGVCKKLKEREWGGQKINNRSTVLMLEYVSIIRWPNLHSIIKLNHFDHLTRLSIESCESLESFSDHELPNLTLLKYLKIIKCPSIDASFPRGFWPPNLHTLGIGKLKKPILEWDTQNFPSSLVELKLYGEDGVSSCSQLSHLLPSSLTSLEIIEFEKLGSFSTGLQHLTFLQHLSFLKCPNMMELTEMLLASLLSFRMINCPNLKERCSEDGCYWPHISHIPCIEID